MFLPVYFKIELWDVPLCLLTHRSKQQLMTSGAGHKFGFTAISFVHRNQSIPPMQWDAYKNYT